MKAPPPRPPGKHAGPGHAKVEMPLKSPPARLEPPPSSANQGLQELPSKQLPAPPRAPSDGPPPSPELPTPFFEKKNNGIILVHAAVVGVHHTVAHKPSGMVSIAVPPPATPVRTTHGLASPDSVVLPSSPGAPPHLHPRAAPAVPQQKSRITFEGDSPRGDAASSGTGGLCASATAQQEQPLQHRSAISLPDRAGKEVPPTRQYRSLWVLAGPTYNACADSRVAGQSRLSHHNCRLPILGCVRRWPLAQRWHAQEALQTT